MEPITTNKRSLSVIFIGDVEAGKSTLLGHLFYLIYPREVPRFLQEYERFRENNVNVTLSSVSCNKYSWSVDKTRVERQRGVTINISFWKLETPRYYYTIIHGPGHPDYLKNMITGISQANVALFVVDCRTHSFETDWALNDQSKQQLLLSITLGIKQVIIAVNKMDLCNYSEFRYNELKTQIFSYLIKIGFQTSHITFLPVSGWINDNLVDKSNNLPWYDGPTLLDALNSLPYPQNRGAQEKPLRISIHDAHHIAGVGTVVLGRVMTGTIKAKMPLSFALNGLQSTARSIEIFHETVQVANVNDIISINCLGIPVEMIRCGEIISDPFNDPARVCLSFQAELKILDHPGVIKRGYSPMMDCHTSHVAVRIMNIDSRTDEDGNILEYNPKFVRKGDCCQVTIESLHPVVVEVFSNYPRLGRFSLRDLRRVVAVGRVTSVQKVDDSSSSHDDKRLFGKGAKT